MKYIKGSEHSINGSVGSVRNGPGVYPMKQASGSQTSVASASSHNLERFSPHSCGAPRKSIWFTKSEAPYFVFLTNSQMISILLVQGPHFENHWTRLVFSLPSSFDSVLADRIRLSLQIVNMFVLSHVQLCAASWTVAHQAPLSMEFPRQEYWSGLSFPPPGDLPDPGTEPTSHVSCIGRLILYH